MRRLAILMALGFVLSTSTGCLSSRISSLGRGLPPLSGENATRDRIQRSLGEPVWTEATGDGASREIYSIRGPISEDTDLGSAWAACYTLGLSEAYLIPKESVEFVASWIVPTKVTVWYDPRGQATDQHFGDVRWRDPEPEDRVHRPPTWW